MKLRSYVLGLAGGIIGAAVGTLVGYYGSLWLLILVMMVFNVNGDHATGVGILCYFVALVGLFIGFVFGLITGCKF